MDQIESMRAYLLPWVYCTLVHVSKLSTGVNNIHPVCDFSHLTDEVAGFMTRSQKSRGSRSGVSTHTYPNIRSRQHFSLHDKTIVRSLRSTEFLNFDMRQEKKAKFGLGDTVKRAFSLTAQCMYTIKDA